MDFNVISKILIIGSGSISAKHYSVLKKINKKFKVQIIPSRAFVKISKNKFIAAVRFNPDYIILASPSSFHYTQLNIIEKNFKSKIILIEKPLFNKKISLPNKLNNEYFVGYNLRYNPVIGFIKNFVKKKKLFFISVFSSSYLPDWRKSINYTKSVSAKKKLGGGVLLELSHEIDYLHWMLGKIKILNCISKRVSNLKIETDDLFLFHGSFKKAYINLSLNFFSKIKKREIIIDGDGFNIFGDLIKNKLVVFHKKKNKIIRKSFGNISNSYTYRLQHLEILNKKNKKLCSLEEGTTVLDFIHKSKLHAKKN